MAAVEVLCRHAPLEKIGGNEMTTYYTYFDSPVDTLLLTSDGSALTGLFMVEHKHGPNVDSRWVRDDTAAPFAVVKSQLARYFAGTLKEFSFPIRAAGTPFQK